MKKDEFVRIVKPYSMTSEERITELFNSLEYIRLNNLDGDFVECGVWKGGNILGIIEYLNYYGITDRQVWLYDTFQGMTQPEDCDVDYKNNKASNILKQVLCYSSIVEVKENLSKSSFPIEKIKFVVGDVCETLDNEQHLPKTISLLRLDTDWYKSTKKELDILYPKLVNKGVLIVDDYGHWAGSKKATDEFFEQNDIEPNIKKIDYTGIKIIKN
jgi:O-methyltransferase